MIFHLQSMITTVGDMTQLYGNMSIMFVGKRAYHNVKKIFIFRIRSNNITNSRCGLQRMTFNYIWLSSKLLTGCSNCDTQFIGGGFDNEGTVQACYNNLWSLISDSNCDNDTRVVCIQLGYTGGS